MTVTEKKRTVPGVGIRDGKAWVTRWREGGRSRSIQLGPVNSMTREEALAEARRRKEEVFGELAEPRTQHVVQTVEQTADGKSISDLAAEVKELRGLIEGLNTSIGLMLGVDPQPAKPLEESTENATAFSVDVAAIRAEREAFIAEEIERMKGVKYTCSEGNKTVFCNTCGSDFDAYVGEAIHCPRCTSTDLRYATDTHKADGLPDAWQTIYARIVLGGADANKRDKAAEKRLRSLRAKTTKHPATLEIQEGWVDESPEKDRLWSSMGLTEDDKYCYYTRCGEFEMQGFKAPGDAKNGLVSHCKGCAERREGCQMPEVQEPMPVPHDCCENLPATEGTIMWCHDDYTWVSKCVEFEKDYKHFKTETEARESLTKHCSECSKDHVWCWKHKAAEPTTPETKPEAKQEESAFSDDDRVPGVTWNKNRRTWELKTMINGKRTYIKSFADKKDAVKRKIEEDAKEAARLAAMAEARDGKQQSDLTPVLRAASKMPGG